MIPIPQVSISQKFDVTDSTEVMLEETGWQGPWSEFVGDNEQFIEAPELERIRQDLIKNSRAIIGRGAAYQFTLVLA